MNIFITGVTGFLGGEMLMLLSKRQDVKKIYCLIRADGPEEAAHRLADVFAFHEDYFDKERIMPIVGNLMDGMLGKKLMSHAELSAIDVIIHAAANTSFSRIYDHLVERVNIGGTCQILEWAKILPHLQVFVYVGTATICGKKITNRLVYEDESPDPEAQHLVKYCRTKMIGEMHVRASIPKEKLLIVRPSIIMGDSRNWTPRSYVIMWAVAAFDMIRLLPVNPHSSLDIIPVDYASRAIVELLFANRNFNTYHISAGPKRTSNLGLLTAAVDSENGKPAIKFVSNDNIGQLKLWARKKLGSESPFSRENVVYFQHLADVLNGNGNLRMLLAALDAYFNFAELGQTFDNSRLLADTSIGPSEPAHVYMQRCKKHIRNIDVLEGAIDP